MLFMSFTLLVSHSDRSWSKALERQNWLAVSITTITKPGKEQPTDGITMDDNESDDDDDKSTNDSTR